MSNLNRRRKFGFNEAKEANVGVGEDDEDFDRTVHLHPEDPEVRLGQLGWVGQGKIRLGQLRWVR